MAGGQSLRAQAARVLEAMKNELTVPEGRGKPGGSHRREKRGRGRLGDGGPCGGEDSGRRSSSVRRLWGFRGVNARENGTGEQQGRAGGSAPIYRG